MCLYVYAKNSRRKHRKKTDKIWRKYRENSQYTKKILREHKAKRENPQKENRQSIEGIRKTGKKGTVRTEKTEERERTKLIEERGEVHKGDRDKGEHREDIEAYRKETDRTQRKPAEWMNK